MNSSQQPTALSIHFRRAYLRRPQMLLFLGISYALWASVTLRWLMEFMEQSHPQTVLVAGLLLLFGGVMGLEPLLTARSALRGHLYLLFQLAVVLAAMLTFFQLDFFAILLLPLAGQATFVFRRRPAAPLWVGILLLANVLGQLDQFGWPEALPFIFLYTGAILFVAAFSLMTLRAEAARRRSERLLAELTDAHEQLSQTHEQLRAYAGQAEELAVAQERNRLARELHDSVAQTLYGLTLQSEAAARRLAAGQVEQVADSLRFFQRSARQTLQETRLLIFQLRPPILDEVGLAAALRARVDAVEARSAIACEVELQPMAGLAPEAETALYRIAQEALNNAIKHACAGRVSLALRREKETLCLTIADDGTGFDVAQASGFGLAGMRERTEQLGATLTVLSAPGEGTTVVVELPFASETAQLAEHARGGADA